MNFGPVQYRIVQYYAREDVPSIDYFFVDLRNCVTLAGDVYPMMAVSFSHFCWVSERLDIQDGDGTFKRKLMLATFPSPFTPYRQNVLDRSCVRNMEIPDAILENAARIFLVPHEGSIMVLTTGRKLHTFRFT